MVGESIGVGVLVRFTFFDAASSATVPIATNAEAAAPAMKRLLFMLSCSAQVGRRFLTLSQEVSVILIQTL